jgi:hypothetical protein
MGDRDTPARASRAPSGGQTRREFLRLSALTLAAAAAADAAVGIPREPRTRGAASTSGRHSGAGSRGNAFPGRIILSHDPAMNGQGVIDPARVEAVVQQGVRVLTGVPDTAAAFEALFPGLSSTSRIAIKVNCIGATDTRWETARGVVAGLALMLDGTYDVSRVTIYDNRDFINHVNNPFRAVDFTFNGHTPVIDNSYNNCSAYYAYEDHRLTTYLVDADYVINMPALKSHNRPYQQLTLAFKNHYGSCCPSDICDDIPGMLTLNADPHIRDKTCLVLMDGLRGTYDGPPQQAPQVWQTFTEGTPNLLFFSTDPVTNEYWGREIINLERLAHGLEPKPATWVEQASDAPYNLGVSDEELMTVVRHDPAAVPGEESVRAGAFFLSIAPNPVRDAATLHLHCAAPGRIAVTIVDATGRRVRDLGEHAVPAGPVSFRWDGRAEDGQRVSAGVYFAQVMGERGRDRHRLLRVD